MSDSEEKKTEQPVKEKAPAVTEAMMRYGKTTIAIRGEGGRFQKKKKSPPKSEEITGYMRDLLSRAEAGPDGKIVKGTKTRFRKMFDNIFEIASMPSDQPAFDKKGNIIWLEEPEYDENDKNKVTKPGVPLLVKDAKLAMASTQAFKELMLRAYGMPTKSDEEIDAMRKEGVKIVIVAPPNMVNKDIVEEKPKERPTPSFIEAEITENK